MVKTRRERERGWGEAVHLVQRCNTETTGSCQFTVKSGSLISTYFHQQHDLKRSYLQCVGEEFLDVLSSALWMGTPAEVKLQVTYGQQIHEVQKKSSYTMSLIALISKYRFTAFPRLVQSLEKSWYKFIDGKTTESLQWLKYF